MLELAILGLLRDRDLHGYEIRKQLRDQLGLLANVSFGSLYPALGRLEAAGEVMTVEPAAASTAPPTGSLTGEWAVRRARRHTSSTSRRSRKVYRITETGRRSFAERLAGPTTTDDDRSFGLRWAFARYLAPPARVALLERRRAQLVQRLARMEAAENPALDAYARSVVEHSLEAAAQDIGWLDRLIQQERAQLAGSGAGPGLST